MLRWRKKNSLSITEIDTNSVESMKWCLDNLTVPLNSIRRHQIDNPDVVRLIADNPSRRWFAWGRPAVTAIIELKIKHVDALSYVRYCGDKGMLNDYINLFDISPIIGSHKFANDDHQIMLEHMRDHHDDSFNVNIIDQSIQLDLVPALIWYHQQGVDILGRDISSLCTSI